MTLTDITLVIYLVIVINMMLKIIIAEDTASSKNLYMYGGIALLRLAFSPQDMKQNALSRLFVHGCFSRANPAANTDM